MATSAHSSHPTFSYTDDIAATWTDFLLLVGRVLLGWYFLVLALQLLFLSGSESMGNHDSNIVDAGRVD